MSRGQPRDRSKRSRLLLYTATAVILAIAGWWFIARLRSGEAHKVVHTFLNAIRQEDASAILQICHPEEVEALSLCEADILPTLRALRAWFFSNGIRTSVAKISQHKRMWLAVLQRQEPNGKRTQYEVIIYKTPYGPKLWWTGNIKGFAVTAVREELRSRDPVLASSPPRRGTLLRQLIEQRAMQWGIHRVWTPDGEIRTLPSPPN